MIVLPLAAEPHALQTVWFLLIAVLWIGYLVLEGFDYGVGMLIPFIGKNEKERRVIVNTIGPVWDSNQVWTDIFSYGSLVGGWDANTPVAVYNTAGVLQNVSTQGYFTVSGTTLNWTAVPELSNLLVGGVLAAGLLRRRRIGARA